MTETLTFDLPLLLERLHPGKQVLIIGSAFADLMLKMPRLPQPGGDMPAQYQGVTIGGCSFNTADVLSKFKLPFEALLPIGEGMMAELIRAEFVKRGYPLRIFLDCGDNGWCLTLVEDNAERTFLTIAGIETRFEAEWIREMHPENYDFIYMSGYQTEGANAKVMLDGLQAAGQNSVIFYDTGPRAPHIDPAFLAQLEQQHRVLYSVNADEAAALTGRSDPKQVALDLSARTHEPCIVTLGEKGALVCEQGHCVLVPGFKIEPVDTVGAGDAHSGGVLAGLMSGFSLQEAVYLGNACAAFVSAHAGAACAARREELLQFFQGSVR